MRKGIIYVYFNRAKYEKEGIEKYYIGQTIGTMEQRAGKDGRRYGWDDSNCNSKFARSIRKWGWDAFEGRILEEVYEEDLNELEKFYIEQFNSYKNGYNSTLGGDSNSGYIRSEESREKQSETMKKRYEDPKEREKLSKIQRKRFEDEKEREKTSLAGKKRFEDKKEREKISKTQKKRCKDQKVREKMSELAKTSWKNPERKKIQSEKLSGEKNGMYGKGYKIAGELSINAKKVYCNELNILFSYIKLAEKYCINILNIKIGPICYACDGKRKSTGKLADGTKLTWNWLEDVDQETLDKAEFIDSKKYEEILYQNVNVCNK